MKISRSITYLLKKVFELSQTKNMFPDTTLRPAITDIYLIYIVRKGNI